VRTQDYNEDTTNTSIITTTAASVTTIIPTAAVALNTTVATTTTTVTANTTNTTGSRDSAVGIATEYGLDDRKVRVRVPVWSNIFSSQRRRNLLWSPPSLLSNGYPGLFPRV
jgi:hypothetical protein